jgi:hypothetical protein
MRILSTASGDIPLQRTLPAHLAHYSINNATVNYFHSTKGNEYIIQKLTVDQCSIYFSDIITTKAERYLIEIRQPCAELIISLNNTFALEVDDNEVQLYERGMNLLYTPVVLRYLEVKPDNNYSSMIIHMPVKWLNQLFHGNEPAFRRFFFQANNNETILLSNIGNHIADRSLLQLVDDIKCNAHVSQQLQSSTVQLLLRAVNAIGNNKENIQAPVNEKELQLAYEIKPIIINNLQTIHATESLVEKYNSAHHPAWPVTSYKLNKVCRYVYGITAADLISELRMSKAVELLLSKEKPLMDVIAKQIGFKDAGTFSRAFSDYYQLTPSQYRNQYQNMQIPPK